MSPQLRPRFSPPDSAAEAAVTLPKSGDNYADTGGYREELFPSLVFRQAYDALRVGRGDRADVEYVRILDLAAHSGEAMVEAALDGLLTRAEAFDYATLKTLVQPQTVCVPFVHIEAPDLSQYDLLIAGDDA